MEQVEKQVSVREELQSTVDAASLLLDGQVYTEESYRELLKALGRAKMVLHQAHASEEALLNSLAQLCEAVDALSARCVEEQENGIRTWMPYLLGGMAIGGLALCLHITKKHKEQK